MCLISCRSLRKLHSILRELLTLDRKTQHQPKLSTHAFLPLSCCFACICFAVRWRFRAGPPSPLNTTSSRARDTTSFAAASPACCSSFATRRRSSATSLCWWLVSSNKCASPNELNSCTTRSMVATSDVERTTSNQTKTTCLQCMSAAKFPPQIWHHLWHKDPNLAHFLEPPMFFLLLYSCFYLPPCLPNDMKSPSFGKTNDLVNVSELLLKSSTAVRFCNVTTRRRHKKLEHNRRHGQWTRNFQQASSQAKTSAPHLYDLDQLQLVPVSIGRQMLLKATGPDVSASFLHHWMYPHSGTMIPSGPVLIRAHQTNHEGAINLAVNFPWSIRQTNKQTTKQ